MLGKKDLGGRARGLWGAAGLLIIGIVAAVTSAGTAHAAMYVDPLTSASFIGFDTNLLPTGGFYDVSPSASGAVFTRATGSGDGSAELLSRFTFSGNFRLTVDVAGLSTGLGYTAESGIGIKGPGCCANRAFADIFGYGNDRTGANNYLGLTELSRTSFAGGDRLALAGDTGGARYQLNLVLVQEFGGIEANRVTFTNLTVTADTINATVPEPAAWAMLLTGFALTGAAARRRPSSRVVAALAFKLENDRCGRP